MTSIIAQSPQVVLWMVRRLSTKIARDNRGLTAFKHHCGTLQKATIIEVDGSGVGLIDYDNDGWLDVYMLNGSTSVPR